MVVLYDLKLSKRQYFMIGTSFHVHVTSLPRSQLKILSNLIVTSDIPKNYVPLNHRLLKI